MRSGGAYDEGDEALGEYQEAGERFVGGFSVVPISSPSSAQRAEATPEPG